MQTITYTIAAFAFTLAVQQMADKLDGYRSGRADSNAYYSLYELPKEIAARIDDSLAVATGHKYMSIVQRPFVMKPIIQEYNKGIKNKGK